MGEPASVRAYSAAFSRVDAQAPDWDAFTGKGGVLALADAAAAEGCMGPSREAYPALLARYPLCYGFWKKWALQEWAQCSPLGDGRVPQPDRAAALMASVAVWESGVQAVTHSVEHWVNYCEFLGAQCGDDPARVRSALLRGVACCALDPKAGALWEPYKTFRELVADKDAVGENPMFTVLDQPGIGPYPVAATPLQFGAVPRQPPRVAPTLGQHTDEILSAILGLPDHEISRLHDDKVVAGPR